MLQDFCRNPRGESATERPRSFQFLPTVTPAPPRDLEALNPSPSGISLNGNPAAFDFKVLTGVKAPNYLAIIWLCNKAQRTAAKCNTIWGRSEFACQKGN
jgi:hypothetical protein